MSLDAASRAHFNLKNAVVLLVQNDSMGMDILVQILVGFGAKNLLKAATIDEAKGLIAKNQCDLMIVDAVLGEEDGFDLVDWMRREASAPNRFAPLLMITAHTQQSRVSRSRDVGAHFVIAKPLTPVVLLERILWVAREQRPFVECAGYSGPDRRFKFEGPPDGIAGRRRDDLAPEVGIASQPNMSQDEIDALMAPRKVSI